MNARRSKSAVTALCVLAVSGGLLLLSRPGAAQKPAAKPAAAKPAAPKPAAAPKGRGKSISGTGFTLQEKTGNLDQEALEYLGNPKTEAAVKKALKYLADSQNPDGSWGDARFSSDV